MYRKYTSVVCDNQQLTFRILFYIHLENHIYFTQLVIKFNPNCKYLLILPVKKLLPVVLLKWGNKN